MTTHRYRWRRARRGTAVAGALALAVGCLAVETGGTAAASDTRAAAAAAAAAAASGAEPAAAADTSEPTGALVPAAPGIRSPGKVLTHGWNTSKDRSVEVTGDDNGLNVLVADAASGYSWRTAATLSEPGFDTPRWIGNDCVTGSGRYAAVVYAPWSFNNDATAEERGSFAAIVDLDTGAVRKLDFLTSLDYFSPGCGTGDQAAFSALNQGATATTTRLDLVDAADGRLAQGTTLAGQVTSAVPYAGGMAAAAGDSLIQVTAKGARRVLATEQAGPLRLHPDADGGLGYEVVRSGNQQLKRFARGRSSVVATAKSGSLQLQGVAGHVYVVGPRATATGLAAGTGGWRALDGSVDATPSTEGQLLVTQQLNAPTRQFSGSKAPAAGTGAADTLYHRVALKATVVGNGRSVSFTVDPAARRPKDGSAPSPALTLHAPVAGSRTVSPKAKSAATAQGTVARKARSTDSADGTMAPKAGNTGGAMTAAAADAASSTVNANDASNPATVTWDPVRGCAVARNDRKIQTFQANPQQIEWAADLAVQGQLTTQTRGVDWEGSGMQISWTPQGMFPLQPLDGGGSVPAQVLLGVLAQESNTLQASSHAVDAETGNFNQGGFYGSVSDPGTPNGTTWDTVDCGYGVGQVTTGMTLGYTGNVADGSPAFTTAQKQQAIATDYASNVSATLNMLIDKWNQLYEAGILANDGDPQYIENWYFAAWAYNSGVQPNAALGGSGCTPGPDCTDSDGNWGLGWTNNPADPSYPADRPVFSTSDDWNTSHPQYWPYQEKVLGWAASPVVRYDWAGGYWRVVYKPGNWGTPGPHYPGNELLCTSADNCVPGAATDASGTKYSHGADSAGMCTLADFHCWWHASKQWVDCTSVCGTQSLTYTAASPRPSFTDIYPPDGCTGSGLPANAVIVDDSVSAGVCSGTPSWHAQGTESFFFPASENPACTADCIDYKGKIDFHQLGAGYGGHMFFSHMINTPNDNAASYTDDSMTATWTPPTTVSGWTRLKVHIPSTGATTRQADYQIDLGDGEHRHRLVNQYQNQNTWIDLGSFYLYPGASVSLSNYNTYAPQGDGGDVAFDAVAFIPTAKPLVNYVALGDSYSAGDGLTPYQYGSNIAYNNGASDYCNRSATEAYSEELDWPGLSGTIAANSAAGGPANFAFLACSGAQTVDMTPSAVDPNNPWNTDWGSTAANNADYGELSEVEAAGYLDPDTTLVTLTIGGNDARFSDVVSSCFETLDHDCTGPDYYLTHNSKVDPEPLSTYEPEVINAEQSHLKAVYEAVHRQAPNARILVLGYPHMLPTDLTVPECVLLADPIIYNSVDWLNQMSDALNSAIDNAVHATAADNPGLRISFVDVRPTFTGHEVCSDDPWINGTVFTGSGTAFHPTANGDGGEANQLNALLN
ncbi:GDSL-type esterase/lipase family protein [Peterkaempfera sp. SMS 1(5)a]|uniref:golvesin C-terminal-like domain-containing protein n=1 Tax=Peterkaempfera podocarpi TaxID=3232308 RepID=UPI00366C1F2D